MRLYCYLQIKPLDEIKFTSTKSSEFRANGYLAFEADSHSDTFLMEQGKQLVQEASDIFLEIDANENENIGKLSLFFEYLRKSELTVTYSLEGNHERIEKMLRFIRAERTEDISAYFKSKSSTSR